MDLMSMNAGVEIVDKGSGCLPQNSHFSRKPDRERSVEFNDYPLYHRYADHSSTALMSSIGTVQVTFNVTGEEIDH